MPGMSVVFKVSLIRVLLWASLSLLFLLGAIVWVVPGWVNIYAAAGWSGLQSEIGAVILLAPIGFVAFGWWAVRLLVMYLDPGLAVDKDGLRSTYLLGHYKNVTWSDVLEVAEKSDPKRRTSIKQIVIYLKNTQEMYGRLPLWCRWYHINPLHIVIATTMYQKSHKEIFETIFQHHQSYLMKHEPKNESNLI